jgi:hypothetical protein
LELLYIDAYRYISLKKLLLWAGLVFGCKPFDQLPAAKSDTVLIECVKALATLLSDTRQP